ncbi:sigma-70 family RNA polymerase sigma factor [Rhodohalobacter halophilus]|uniref:sigma-70 family RNA polymerase sigma factor n=1 Tax=Rhodohalobacter halophilus TaxID=1812810 RepID=UPI00083F5369|nr:sigma-70 family RNA polymerase sigma factor [Rhodohalobacter halophilus]
MERVSITSLLKAHSSGDEYALDQLIPLVYSEMHRMAEGRLIGERPDHTYSATALVHEAYLKLVDFNKIDWKNRNHFFGIASQVMRNILVNYAVRKKADKRGGDNHKVTLSAEHVKFEADLHDIITVDSALKKLEQIDARQAKVVECRFFGGLTISETAGVLGISEPTVSRDWQVARAWLNREISR